MKKSPIIAVILLLIVWFVPKGHANQIVWLTTDPIVNEAWPGWSATTTNGYYVGTKELYTALLLTNQPNHTFYYLPGTYETKGANYGNTAGEGCKHFGATNGLTTIKLADPANPIPFTSVMFSSLTNGLVGISDGFELRDMKLDCNADNLPGFTGTNQMMCTAASVVGNDLVFSNLYIVGFGARGGKECFPLVSKPDPRLPITTFSNVIVVNCTFTAPATNNVNACCLTVCELMPGLTTNGLKSVLANAVIRNCLVSNVVTEGFYTSQALVAPLIENNIVDGCTKAVYFEVGNPIDFDIPIIVRSNSFRNVRSGVHITYADTNYSMKVGDMTVVSNQFYLLRENGSAGFYVYNSSPEKIASVTIENNSIEFIDGTNTFGQDCKAFQLLSISNALVRDNICDLTTSNVYSRWQISVYSNAQSSVDYYSIYENRSSSNILLPIFNPSVPATNGTQHKGDFDLNTHVDILWRNMTTGSNRVWRMSGTNVIATNYLNASTVTPLWSIESTADLTLDCNTDLLWRQPGNTNIGVWRMDGTNFVNSFLLQNSLPTNWTLAATGDLNDDGKQDIIWRDYKNGSNAVWFMDGTNLLSSSWLAGTTTNWHLSAVSDFNGDAKPDLLWREYGGGGLKQVAYWYMDGTNYISSAVLTSEPDDTWRIRGVGDFNQDAKTDLLWWNYSTGGVALWFMDNTNRLGTLTLPSEPNLNWQIRGPK